MNGTQFTIAIVVIAALGVLTIGAAFGRRKSVPTTTNAPRSGSVTFDDERVVCIAGGRRMEVRWDDLIGVAIETTDQGPAVDDVFFILAGATNTLVCPSEADGAQTLLGRLQKLRTFDNEAVVSAMSCTENRTFICWDKWGRHNIASEAASEPARSEGSSSPQG